MVRSQWRPVCSQIVLSACSDHNLAGSVCTLLTLLVFLVTGRQTSGHHGCQQLCSGSASACMPWNSFRY